MAAFSPPFWVCVWTSLSLLPYKYIIHITWSFPNMFVIGSNPMTAFSSLIDSPWQDCWVRMWMWSTIRVLFCHACAEIRVSKPSSHHDTINLWYFIWFHLIINPDVNHKYGNTKVTAQQNMFPWFFFSFLFLVKSSLTSLDSLFALQSSFPKPWTWCPLRISPSEDQLSATKDLNYLDSWEMMNCVIWK